MQPYSSVQLKYRENREYLLLICSFTSFTYVKKQRVVALLIILGRQAASQALDGVGRGTGGRSMMFTFKIRQYSKSSFVSLFTFNFRLRKFNIRYNELYFRFHKSNFHIISLLLLQNSLITIISDILCGSEMKISETIAL